MPIYTKTGDKGDTSLFGGKRVSKSEARVDAYGSVDELNSWIGLVESKLSLQEKKEFLQKIQADLFIIGATLAGWDNDLSALETRVTEMEVEIDVMEKALEPLTSFVLPGGNEVASTIHITRSVCRRVERQVVGFSKKEAVDDRILQYFNRLSDLFFVLARFINMNAGVADVHWIGIPRNVKQK